MAKISGLAALNVIADHGSIHVREQGVAVGVPANPSYCAELARAAERSGQSESVTCVELKVGEVPAVGLAWDFDFLGGSVGMVAAARIVDGIRFATMRGLPLLSLPRSGGTRMQEGTVAFAQMVAIGGALVEHRRARLPHLVHLGGPTMGGVMATVGSAADLTTAEPGAAIGFLGPRAVEAVTGVELPSHAQRAETLAEIGLVDQVLDLTQLREKWSLLLAIWADRPQSAPQDWPPIETSALGPRSQQSEISSEASAEQVWADVTHTRNPARVDARDLLGSLTQVVEVPNASDGNHSAFGGFGRLDGRAIAFVATTDRRSSSSLTVPDLRKLRRIVELGSHWGLPLLCVVDTLGAELSETAERSGMVWEISKLLCAVAGAQVPTVSILLGAGTGGAALALLGTDRVIAADRAWLAPLPPEGAAAILAAGPGDPAVVAHEQGISARSMAEHGLVDCLVSEVSPGWPAEVLGAASQAFAEIQGGHDSTRRMGRFAAWSRQP